jgi:hypothetical protein
MLTSIVAFITVYFLIITNSGDSEILSYDDFNKMSYGF